MRYRRRALAHRPLALIPEDSGLPKVPLGPPDVGDKVAVGVRMGGGGGNGISLGTTGLPGGSCDAGAFLLRLPVADGPFEGDMATDDEMKMEDGHVAERAKTFRTLWVLAHPLAPQGGSSRV